MAIHFETPRITLHHGDCLDVLRSLPDASVDSVVTDPPYGLGNTSSAQVAETVTRWVGGDREYLPGGSGFMGKAWDAFVPPVAVWDECLRVLKPGGHLLAFAGSRTFDLMALGVRLAGFDVRDSVAWLYGNGFPKSRDVSEQMERFLADGPTDPEATRDRPIPPGIYAVTGFLRDARNAAGWTNKQIDALFGTNGMAGHWTTQGSQPAVPSVRQWQVLKEALGFDNSMDDLAARLASTERPEDWGENPSEGFLDTLERNRDADAAGGWGTALKPSFEPVVVARKQPVGTASGNVQAYGTGALNIEGCRVGGRWPANVALDESQAPELDRQSGKSASTQRNGTRSGKADSTAYGTFAGQDDVTMGHDDFGGASRFFYVPKAGSAERVRLNGTAHPTVKPLDLMRWLTRLVTPPGGTVLEPFAGSGTTVEAALLEGFRCIAAEREADYLPLIVQRVNRRTDPVAAVAATGDDSGLFDLLAREETA